VIEILFQPGTYLSEVFQMEQYILTPPEADIISTIRNDDEATIYEITTATRLTPSEAVEVLNDLRDRNLVRLIENRRARLTDEGRHVRMLIEQQEKQPYSTGSGAAPVIVISGEDTTRASRRALEELKPEELDLALDSELEKLAQEAGQT